MKFKTVPTIKPVKIMISSTSLRVVKTRASEPSANAKTVTEESLPVFPFW